MGFSASFFHRIVPCPGERIPSHENLGFFCFHVHLCLFSVGFHWHQSTAVHWGVDFGSPLVLFLDKVAHQLSYPGFSGVREGDKSMPAAGMGPICARLVSSILVRDGNQTVSAQVVPLECLSLLKFRRHLNLQHWSQTTLFHVKNLILHPSSSSDVAIVSISHLPLPPSSPRFS